MLQVEGKLFSDLLDELLAREVGITDLVADGGYLVDDEVEGFLDGLVDLILLVLHSSCQTFLKSADVGLHLIHRQSPGIGFVELLLNQAKHDVPLPPHFLLQLPDPEFF